MLNGRESSTYLKVKGILEKTRKGEGQHIGTVLRTVLWHNQKHMEKYCDCTRFSLKNLCPNNKVFRSFQYGTKELRCIVRNQSYFAKVYVLSFYFSKECLTLLLMPSVFYRTTNSFWLNTVYVWVRVCNCCSYVF